MRFIFSRLFHMTAPVSLIAITQKIYGRHATPFNTLIRRFSSCDQEDDMSKIGINGFGRIGRLVLRAALERGGQVRWRTINLKIGPNLFSNSRFFSNRSSPSMTPSSVSITWSTCSSMTPPTASSREKSRPRVTLSLWMEVKLPSSANATRRRFLGRVPVPSTSLNLPVCLRASIRHRYVILRAE